MVCEDEAYDEHYVVSHLLAPLTLAVCYECFSWRDTRETSPSTRDPVDR
jgi:hypothetical protein